MEVSIIPSGLRAWIFSLVGSGECQCRTRGFGLWIKVSFSAIGLRLLLKSNVWNLFVLVWCLVAWEYDFSIYWGSVDVLVLTWSLDLCFRTSWPIDEDHYTVDWDGVFLFSVSSGQSVCNACVNLTKDGQSRRQLVSWEVDGRGPFLFAVING